MELEIKAKVQTRQLLQGRLTAAKWMSMSEPEVAKTVGALESDPMFQRLSRGGGEQPPLIRRKRWPATRLHSGFYEVREDLSAGSESADVQDLVEKHKDLLGLIRRIGQEAFERHFLHGEDGRPLGEVCRKLRISEEDGRRILDLLLEVGTRSEFFRPPAPSAGTGGLRYHCIARIDRDPRQPEGLYFSFLAPHWVRGKYEVSYEELERWKKEQRLAPEEKSRLRGLLKTIELLNMRQDVLFQILSRATTAQAGYLTSRKPYRCRPLSLRELARRIGVAASTVSRAVGRRAVELPWGEQVPLKSLLTGQRTVVLRILGHWDEEGGLGEGVTDEALMRRLAEESGVSVSRRTVNECRRKLREVR